jgi:hypothetical protein
LRRYIQVGKSHIALVTRHGRQLARAWSQGADVAPDAVQVLGVITVEDVLEELIGEEIYDEDDYGDRICMSGPSSTGSAAGAGATAGASEEGRDGSGSGGVEAGVELNAAYFPSLAAIPAVLSAVRKFKLLAAGPTNVVFFTRL